METDAGLDLTTLRSGPEKNQESDARPNYPIHNLKWALHRTPAKTSERINMKQPVNSAAKRNCKSAVHEVLLLLGILKEKLIDKQRKKP